MAKNWCCICGAELDEGAGDYCSVCRSILDTYTPEDEKNEHNEFSRERNIELIKSSGIPCSNRTCTYWNSMFEQNCSAELNDGTPFIIHCSLYKPSMAS
jgi:hypothetical protein